MNLSTAVVIAGLRLWAVDAAGQSATERLTLIGPGQEVVAVIDGGPSYVVIAPKIDAMLLRGAAAITMVHNHPNSVGLSADDLAQLAKPGVAAIVAIGADGSRYEASRGPAYDTGHFEDAQYHAAHEEVLRQLLLARAHDPTMPSFDDEVAHLISIALQKARVLGYRSTLSNHRAALCGKYRWILGTVTEAAAARVRNAGRR